MSPKQYKLLLKYLGVVLGKSSQLKTLDSREVKNSFNQSFTTFSRIAKQWWSGEISFLTIKYPELTGLSIRLYKSQFTLGRKLLAKSCQKQGSVYLKYRERVTNKIITKKLGDYTPETFKVILESANKIIASNQLGVNLLAELRPSSHKKTTMTLSAFLESTFYEIKLAENPRTVDNKINSIKYNFSHLLGYDLSMITAEIIKEWLKSKERKLTKKQIRAGESRWIVQPSTIKSAVCTIRSCIQLAKTQGIIAEHDLYSIPSFKMDNEIVRYLSKAEEERLFKAINVRNELRLAERERTISHRLTRGLIPPNSLGKCAFADHVTPLIILFKETGIRPGTIMNSVWNDVDFESRFFRIRKSIDKKARANFVPLNELAINVLKEWRKHHIHKDCQRSISQRSKAWLFPSPQDPEQQLLSIKSAWRGIIRAANIDNFRFYDLRHDFASKVMMETGNIYLVSDLLNHRQIETTKRYAHLMNESRFDAVRALDQRRNPNALPEFLKERR